MTPSSGTHGTSTANGGRICRGNDGPGIVLTDGARELLDRYRDEVAALEARLLAGLTKAEILTLRRTLYACHANLAGHQRG